MNGATAAEQRKLVLSPPVICRRSTPAGRASTGLVSFHRHSGDTRRHESSQNTTLIYERIPGTGGMDELQCAANQFKQQNISSARALFVPPKIDRSVRFEYVGLLSGIWSPSLPPSHPGPPSPRPISATSVRLRALKCPPERQETPRIPLPQQRPQGNPANPTAQQAAVQLTLGVHNQRRRYGSVCVSSR